MEEDGALLWEGRCGGAAGPEGGLAAAEEEEEEAESWHTLRLEFSRQEVQAWLGEAGEAMLRSHTRPPTPAPAHPLPDRR